MTSIFGGRAARAAVAGLCSFAALASAALFSSSAGAQTISTVTFAGPNSITLSGVRYTPVGFNAGSGYSAVVMMHGCTGMWSNRDPTAVNVDGSPNLQNYEEKWGRKLAEEGVVALAVDSFTPREPATLSMTLEDRKSWQNQCSGTTYANAVNAYTTRVADARAAYDYLAANSQIDAANIALLGWSHGAQSVLVQAAETARDSNTSRATSEKVFAASVAFYPGCGSALGFDAPSASYWRPYADLRLNIGDLDSFYANCQTRANIAISTYGSTAGSGHEVVFAGYSGANHHFDSVSESWPTATCSPGTPGSDTCAMNAADIDSLSFLLGRI